MWDQIKSLVGGAAPLLGTALGGPAGTVVGGLVAQALGAKETPEAVRRAIEADPQAMAKLRALEQEHQRELRSMVLEAETARHATQHATMRAEAGASDAYVRRWRPTFGYVASFTWAVQAIALAWSIVAAPEHAAGVINAVTALTPMWGIALAVLGVSITKRSQDKQVAAGQAPPSILGALAQRLSPRTE